MVQQSGQDDEMSVDKSKLGRLFEAIEEAFAEWEDKGELTVEEQEILTLSREIRNDYNTVYMLLNGNMAKGN